MPIKTTIKGLSSGGKGLMKKLLTLAMVFCTANLLFGQIKIGAGVQGYIDVPTGTTLNEDAFNKNYYDVALFEGVGFGFGATAMILQEDLKGFGAQLEAGYAHNEIGWQYNKSTFNMRGKLSYASIDVPLLVGYTFAKGNFRVTPQIGPYLSIPIGSLKYDIERTEYDSKVISNDTYSDTYDINSKIIFGGMGGFKVGYKVGNGLINFDARYMADFNALKIGSSKRGISILTRRKTTFGISYIHFF